MKYVFFYFLFFITTAYSQQVNTFSFSQLLQPVYLGIDKPFFKEDAYGLGYKTPGIVNQGNHYFYLSPNANLIISDGSETGTSSISVGGPNPQVAYLFATNKYVYYGNNPFRKRNEDIKQEVFDLYDYYVCTGQKCVYTGLSHTLLFYEQVY